MTPAPRSEAEHARGILGYGVLVFRWAALAWMVALALTGGGFERIALAWGAIGVAGTWTAWTTVSPRDQRDTSLWAELAIAFGLNAVSGLVVADGTIAGGRPFFATAWPAAAVLAWGVARGPIAGLLSGLILGLGLLLARALNGIAVTELTTAQVQALANATVMYVLAGAGVGVVARAFDRSAAEFADLFARFVGERERAARLAERESLARRIHDSVLQALAMVHKRGREMAARGAVPVEEVAALAEVAGRQEQELRALIMRGPDQPPTGLASLRDALERTAREVTGVPVTVSAVGPIYADAHAVAELADAVRQALENVAEHAAASRATVFAEEEGGALAVTVRDDGAGFVYDAERLREDGKAGILMSMAGRLAALGGTTDIQTAPGAGTRVEFRVPRGEQRA